MSRGDIHGVHICRGAPVVSHLLFADDCLLFFRVDELECNNMMGILASYEQAINFNKSEVFFSRNVSNETRSILSNTLGFQACLGTVKYLGLPSMIGRKKKDVFNYLKIEFGGKSNLGVDNLSLKLAGRFS